LALLLRLSRRSASVHSDECLVEVALGKIAALASIPPSL
jgi:hypothetical protein